MDAWPGAVDQIPDRTVGETSGIEAVEVGDCTMPTDHFLEIVWCSNPG
jgi:hypothetical protein